MHQRALALKAWKEANTARNANLAPVVDYVTKHPNACWPDVVLFIRKNAPFDKRRLAEPIWKTGDKVLRTNLIRQLDWSIPSEQSLIMELITGCAGDTDEPELLAALDKNNAQLADLVSKRPRLTSQLAELAKTSARLPG